MDRQKKTYAKTQVCRELLAGTLTCKTNYEKHIAKVMKFLEITPDILLGNIKHEYNRTRELKKIMKISSEQVAKATNISLSRLEAIEAGEQASLAELRDIAMCFSISVSCLLGKNFFEPQISELDLIINSREMVEQEEISGFWGHIGVSLCNSEKIYYFPITSSVRKMLYNVMNNERIVVPCMNNKVLYINMQYVKELILLDEGVEPPNFIGWDYNVDNGEIPLVMYEALEDYLFDDTDEDIISSKLKICLRNLIEKKELTVDDIYEMVDCSNIYYSDGKIRLIEIDFSQEESVSEEIEGVYLYEDAQCAENILYCTDIRGMEIILNMKNIAMLEVPFLKVENKICKMQEEVYE